MDSDNDGAITSETLDISQINCEKLTVFAPFLLEMEQTKREFSKENFVEAAEKFVETLCVRDIHIIFD